MNPIKTLKQDDLDIESMLKDVEEIEKKIRRTINQSLAEQEKMSNLKSQVSDSSMYDETMPEYS